MLVFSSEVNKFEKNHIKVTLCPLVSKRYLKVQGIQKVTKGARYPKGT